MGRGSRDFSLCRFTGGEPQLCCRFSNMVQQISDVPVSSRTRLAAADMLQGASTLVHSGRRGYEGLRVLIWRGAELGNVLKLSTC